MARRWFEKVESKVRKRRPAAPYQSALASSPPTPSPTPSRPAFQPTPSPPTSTDADTSPLPTLQERLWNQAYDELKVSEPKVVEAYEKILSAELCRNDSTTVASRPTENEIGRARETRCRQMQQLVQEGLDRTQKAASIKRGIDEGLQAVQAVRGIVDKAVHAAPEAAVAWVGVCLGLEILSNPVTEACDNRKGIAYVLSRMEWYWNLVSLLFDKNKAEQSSAELRVQLQEHVMQLYEKLLSYQMKSVCLYRCNWAAVIGRDIVKIDDWAGQLSEIQEAEAAVQRDMEQYNTEESKMQLRKLTDAASAIEMNLQDIYSAIQDQTRQQEKRHQDDGDKQCLKDLREIDPRDGKTRIQDIKGGLLRDSYRRIRLKPSVESDWNACLQTLEGHGSSVASVAFSADGQRLASASRDKTVKVWDAATGACLQTLEGYGGPVFSVAFSVDGQRLASGSHDKTIRVWDAVTGVCVQTLVGHDDSVCSVAFSVDSQRLASGSEDKTVKVWDAVTGACVQTLEGHDETVRSVAISADGQWLASGSIDRTVKVWDAATGQGWKSIDQSI